MSRLLVFDSGLGGLTVLAAIRKARPDADVLYLADDAFFPYGALPEQALVARVLGVMAEAIPAARPDAVVIACNTASTLVLPPLRAAFEVPFVGTVPAIKPAAAASHTKRISVLATPGTVARDYTRALIAEHAGDCRVTLVGAPGLAALAEAALSGAPAPDTAIAAEIAPCFVADEAARTDAVVLACTHYPLLVERLHRLAPWPVAWLDPAPAIARRVVSLLGAARPGAPAGRGEARFTSGRPPLPAIRAALAERGLACG
ncbi:glutamate racemase [Salinarimonas sp.]|uniref:glutamate racemase n=1 Tax=Salinarimonas sp. TaxID=2766526 RepID=UPI0032D9310E